VRKGFVTIATGKEHYFEIAVNLLRTYRLFASCALPFAIIYDRNNAFTEEFDDVILTDAAMNSFNDKFLLPLLSPYDETIFIDADSLAFGDLNQLWNCFSNATDFSAFGKNCPVDDESGSVWYNIEDIGRFGKSATYKTRIHSGVCFIRKSESLKKFYDDCLLLYSHYDEMNFHEMQSSSDEAVMAVAMTMNRFKAVREDSDLFACFPYMQKYQIDISTKKLAYKLVWGGKKHSNGILCHWGTANTYKPVYKYQVELFQARYGCSKEYLRYVIVKMNYRIFLLKKAVGEAKEGIIVSLKRYIKKILCYDRVK